MSSGLALLPVLLQAAPRSQAPDAAWLTFTTAHYRIHCPAAFEAFGRDVAGRIEGLHAHYLGLVGFVHPKPIDLVILDPRMQANGLSWPLLQRPHVVLWKTEPEAEEEGDAFLDRSRPWAELLLSHELGHMHHLLRPARRPRLWERWTAAMGPLAKKSPRWIIEGYATLLEGKLTGGGRPHSALRAAVLRQWALEGKLPAYSALNGTSGFLGGQMAYLAGSAYLEWLESASKDPKALQTLWIRLAGRRDFSAAFRATFGFEAQDGYQRFCAELTHTALELERRAKAEGLREGEIFTQLGGWATDLAVSPDGSKLMARVLDPEKPGLYVWDLKASPKPPAKQPGEPEDHPPLVPTLPPARRLGPLHGALPWKPRWTSSRTLTFQLRLPDAEGMLKPQPWQWPLDEGPAPASGLPPSPASQDLAWKEIEGVWNLVDGTGRPLTRTLAAAWHPAPSPDGKRIYYFQLTAKGIQIRRLDASLPPMDPKPLPQDPAPLVKDHVLPKAAEPSPLPPPVSVEPHPYRVDESHAVFALSGGSVTPSGQSYQIGAGGNDMLHRLNWQVLAATGNGAGPRGAMAGAAWRGWRWAPSFHLFSILERPSRQAFAPVEGFDRERRGVELAFTREDFGRPRTYLRPAAAFERIEGVLGSTASRALLGLEGGAGTYWSQDGQGIRSALHIQAQLGRTEGRSWNLARARATAGWINPWAPLAVHLEGGRLGGDPTRFDTFHLGGVATSLLPAALDAHRVAQPALPAYTATGNRFGRLRGDLGLGPFKAYVEHTTLWQEGQPRPPAQRVLGLELDSRGLPLPVDVLRRLMGNTHFTFGLHRPLDGAMRRRTVATITLIVRP